MSDDNKPVVTTKNRTIRTEGDGWWIEAQVLASGQQIAIRCNGTRDGADDMRICPAVGNMVFISSRASEKLEETVAAATKPRRKGK